MKTLYVVRHTWNNQDNPYEPEPDEDDILIFPSFETADKYLDRVYEKLHDLGRRLVCSPRREEGSVSCRKRAFAPPKYGIYDLYRERWFIEECSFIDDPDDLEKMEIEL